MQYLYCRTWTKEEIEKSDIVCMLHQPLHWIFCVLKRGAQKGFYIIDTFGANYNESYELIYNKVIRWYAHVCTHHQIEGDVSTVTFPKYLYRDMQGMAIPPQLDCWSCGPRAMAFVIHYVLRTEFPGPGCHYLYTYHQFHSINYIDTTLSI